MIGPMVGTIRRLHAAGPNFSSKGAVARFAASTEGRNQRRCRSFRRDGYMILPKLLPAQDVEEIKNFAFATPGLGNDLNKSVTISSNNIPEGQARFHWWMDELVRVPAI